MLSSGVPLSARSHRGRAFARAAACLACLVILGACTSLSQEYAPTPTPLPDMRILAIQQSPAYQLRYPGTVVLYTGYSSRRADLIHPAEWWVSEVFGIRAAPLPAATSTDILDWYWAQLKKLEPVMNWTWRVVA